MLSRAAVTLLLLLSLASCRSSGVPRYTTRVDAVSEHTFVVRLDTERSLDDAQLTGALLTEAARETISRGGLYLRIEALDTNSAIATAPGSVVDSPPKVPDVGNPDISDPEKNAPVAGVGVSIARNRTGSVRFTLSKEPLGGANVFDAADLIDRVREGRTPPLHL